MAREWFYGQRIKVQPRRSECPFCGSDLLLVDSGEAEYDGELAASWGFPDRVQDTGFDAAVTFDPDGFVEHCEHPAFRFMYTYGVEVCASGATGEWFTGSDGDCGYWEYVTPRQYWNPATQRFDAPKPPSPLEQARVERAAQIAAGQMELGL